MGIIFVLPKRYKNLINKSYAQTVNIIGHISIDLDDELNYLGFKTGKQHKDFEFDFNHLNEKEFLMKLKTQYQFS